jgi:hypothetical protein
MSYEFYGPGLGTNGGGDADVDMDFATPADLEAAGIRPSSSAAVPTEEPQTLFEQGWEWFREIAGAKGEQQPRQPAPMPGATPDGKPTAAGFSSYAREAAVREVAQVDEEMAPIEETPPDSPAQQQEDERSWIERYQTHITLISTVVGLGTFVIWLALRKKNGKDERY